MCSTIPKKFVIFGQYKSGTTGFMYKIKNSLPEDPIMLNEPKVYIPEDYNGDYVLAKVIAGLTDGKEAADYQSFMNFDKKIYIVRDPRDWAVSGTLFIIQESPFIYKSDKNVNQIVQLLREKENDPRSIAVVDLLEHISSYIPGLSLEILRAWMNEQYRWLFEFESRLDNYCRIKYEDFVDDNLGNVEDYLGMKLSGSSDVDKTNIHVVRTKGYGNWKNWFTEKDIEFFRPIFTDYMNKLEYGDNWEISREQVIKPEFCSEYVIKTVRLRREKEQQSKYNRSYIGRIKKLIKQLGSKTVLNDNAEIKKA